MEISALSYIQQGLQPVDFEFTDESEIFIVVALESIWSISELHVVITNRSNLSIHQFDTLYSNAPVDSTWFSSRTNKEWVFFVSGGKYYIVFPSTTIASPDNVAQIVLYLSVTHGSTSPFESYRKNEQKSEESTQELAINDKEVAVRMESLLGLTYSEILVMCDMDNTTYGYLCNNEKFWQTLYQADFKQSTQLNARAMYQLELDVLLQIWLQRRVQAYLIVITSKTYAEKYDHTPNRIYIKQKVYTPAIKVFSLKGFQPLPFTGKDASIYGLNGVNITGEESPLLALKNVIVDHNNENQYECVPDKKFEITYQKSYYSVATAKPPVPVKPEVPVKLPLPEKPPVPVNPEVPVKQEDTRNVIFFQNPENRILLVIASPFDEHEDDFLEREKCVVVKEWRDTKSLDELISPFNDIAYFDGKFHQRVNKAKTNEEGLEVNKIIISYNFLARSFLEHFSMRIMDYDERMRLFEILKQPHAPRLHWKFSKEVGNCTIMTDTKKNTAARLISNSGKRYCHHTLSKEKLDKWIQDKKEHNMYCYLCHHIKQLSF